MYEKIKKRMHKNLIIAVNATDAIKKNQLESIENLIKKIVIVKYEMEDVALQRGFSQACKEAISSSTCGVECCKYHFPRNLSSIDFFIATYYMPKEKQRELIQLVSSSYKHQCPILLEYGCFFSFEERPVVCTNAYPCFNDREYWNEKDIKLYQIKKAFKSLCTIIPEIGSDETL